MKFFITAKTIKNKVEDNDNQNFFEKAITSAKQEMKREKVEEKRRERTNNIEEVISLVQCQVNWCPLLTI